MGADLAVTYLNEKAESHVGPLAEKLFVDRACQPVLARMLL